MASLNSVAIIQDRETGIKYRKWIAQDSYCVVLLIHGLGAHSARWQSLGESFVKKNISCYALELKGFGETEEKEGHIDSFDIYYKDLLSLYRIIQEHHGKEKIFLLGESMGGLLAYLLGQRNSDLFNGLICFSPAFKGTLKFRFWEYWGICVSLVLCPRKQFNLPLKSSMCTRDDEYSHKMDKDIREVRVATPRMLYNILKGQKKAFQSIEQISFPVLFLLSGNDQLVDNQITKNLFSRLPVQSKKMIEYPQMYHALSIDIDREKVFVDIIEWIYQQ